MRALIWFSAVPWKALLPPANWLMPRAVCACSHFLCWHITSYPSCISEGRDIPPPPVQTSWSLPGCLWLIYSVFFATVRLPDSPTGYSFCLRNLQSGRLRATFWHQNFCRSLHSATFSIHKLRQIHEFWYVHELESLPRTPWLPSVFGW